jgi:hypothetical protein
VSHPRLGGGDAEPPRGIVRDDVAALATAKWSMKVDSCVLGLAIPPSVLLRADQVIE